MKDLPTTSYSETYWVCAIEEFANYVYAPLESPERIRLLELLPFGKDVGALVKCHLHHKKLREANDNYVAISYA
jgi:hypothetical protein